MLDLKEAQSYVRESTGVDSVVKSPTVITFKDRGDNCYIVMNARPKSGTRNWIARMGYYHVKVTTDLKEACDFLIELFKGDSA